MENRTDSDTTPSPMKRDESLKSLSRDHHQGLLLCWKIRTGLKKTDHARVKNYTDYFFREHLLPHFKLEEKYIFPLLGEESTLVQKAVLDHHRLRTLFEENVNVLQALIQIEVELEKHIRFEERILFKELQRMYSEEELLKLIQMPETEHEDTWEDKFWS